MAGHKQRSRKTRMHPNKHVVKSDFLRFYDKIVGKPAPAYSAKGMRFIKRFGIGFSEPNASLPKIKMFWNRVAPFYLSISSPRRFNKELLLIRRHAPIEPADKIVSIGAGPAISEAFIAKNIATKGQVTCFDSSLKFVRIARKIRDKSGLKNMRVLAGSATRLGLPDSSQDKVLMLQTILANTVHWQSVLREAFRVIKKTPTARLFLTFALERKSDLPKIKSLIVNNGFSPEPTISYGKAGSLFAIFASVRPSFWGQK